MRTIGRFCALGVGDRRLIVEAAVLLTFVSVGLRILPFVTLRRLLDRYGRGRPDHGVSPEQVGRALTVTGGRLPGSSTCLVEALVAEAMLRRHGYASELRLGVLKPGTREPLQGHAWVECQGAVIVGNLENLSDYAVLRAPAHL
jgi:hypothetical protein